MGYMKQQACLRTHILSSTMQASLPDLSPEDRTVIFHKFDLNLNRLIVEAFLHGKSIPCSRRVSAKCSP